MKPALKALPPSEWRIMYMLWRHGPLTVAEVHNPPPPRLRADRQLSPDHNLTTVATFLKRLAAKGYLTTTLERSSPAGGRPPERFYPRVDYAEGLELVVHEFLADYLFSDPAGLAYLVETAQQRLESVRKALPAADGDDAGLSKPS